MFTILTCCSQCSLVTKADCDILGLRLMAEPWKLQGLLNHSRVVCAGQVGAGSNTYLASSEQAVCRNNTVAGNQYSCQKLQTDTSRATMLLLGCSVCMRR